MVFATFKVDPLGEEDFVTDEVTFFRVLRQTVTVRKIFLQKLQPVIITSTDLNNINNDNSNIQLTFISSLIVANDTVNSQVTCLLEYFIKEIH